MAPTLLYAPLREAAGFDNWISGARLDRGGGEGLARLKRVLWHLLAGTRGGPLRVRILRHVLDRPSNVNQVATALAIDYKTAQHHLRVLTENRVLSPTGSGYGAVYLPTREMGDSMEEFERIARKVAPGATPPGEARRVAGTGAPASNGEERGDRVTGNPQPADPADPRPHPRRKEMEP